MPSCQGEAATSKSHTPNQFLQQTSLDRKLKGPHDVWLRRLLGNVLRQNKAADISAEVFVPSSPDRMKSLGFTEEYLAHRRARYLAEYQHFAIERMECGVLFFMAFWSGPA